MPSEAYVNELRRQNLKEQLQTSSKNSRSLKKTQTFQWNEEEWTEGEYVPEWNPKNINRKLMEIKRQSCTWKWNSIKKNTEEDSS